MEIPFLTPERHFYHSFPRRHTDDTIQRGLAILKCMKEVGLILAPEIVTWSIPQIDGTLKEISNRQLRICFTELSEPELREHTETFGPFSIEFKIDVLRKLGALPVIYVPQMVEGDRLLSSLGPVIVWMFENARSTMALLDQLDELSNPDSALAFARRTFPEAQTVHPDYQINLANQDERGECTNQFSVPANVVRGILNFLNYRTAPFALMKGALWAAQNLFYPTDDMVHDRLLSYYRQREWRIIPGISVDGSVNARGLTADEKQILLNIDEQFWSREIRDDKGTFRRLDEARTIDIYQGRHISELISRVLVPANALEPTKKIFGDLAAASE